MFIVKLALLEVDGSGAFEITRPTIEVGEDALVASSSSLSLSSIATAIAFSFIFVVID